MYITLHTYITPVPISSETAILQVRTKSGGGTKTLTMSKSDRREDLTRESIKVFFPDNVLPRFGKKEDFEFEITDYQGIPLNNEVTIQKVSDITKLSNLGFYLYTCV